MMKNELMTSTQTLKADAARFHELSLDEVETSPAPNGGTVVWHHQTVQFPGGGAGEDYFCLCWQRADGTVIWNQYAYDFTPDGQEPLEYQAGF